MELEVAEKKRRESVQQLIDFNLLFLFLLISEKNCYVPDILQKERRKPRYKKFSKRRKNVWVELAGLCGLFRTYVIIQKEYSLKY